jgi:hypothetical protein
VPFVAGGVQDDDKDEEAPVPLATQARTLRATASMMKRSGGDMLRAASMTGKSGAAAAAVAAAAAATDAAAAAAAKQDANDAASDGGRSEGSAKSGMSATSDMQGRADYKRGGCQASRRQAVLVGLGMGMRCGNRGPAATAVWGLSGLCMREV